MNPLFAVIFSNDPDFPSQLQFCNVASDEDFLEGAGTNVTESLAYAKEIAEMCRENYPEIDYRVVEIVLKEIV